jgi:hypothetical protein
VAQLGILFAFGTFLLLKAFKLIRRQPKFGIVEFWLFIMLAYLATVFLRNPVGVEALGSVRVGGRPYLDVVIAWAGFWVLARVVATPRQAFLVIFAGVVGNGFSTLLNLIADHFPSTVGPLSRLYSGIAAAADLDGNPLIQGEEGDARQTYWRDIGASAFTVACCFWRPFTLINPLFIGRFLVFLFAAHAILASGFRSAFFGMIEIFLVCSYFRRGWPEVFRASLVAGAGLVLLLALQNTVLPLPLPAQRALSFLPGNWDYGAKSEAEGSTEWRVKMWKVMLTEDKYISNKLLGDGFGYTAEQFQTMLANAAGPASDTSAQQENLLISGGVHSGPVSAIRYVGVLGLVLFLILLGLIARRGVRLIHRAEGTPFYPLTLLIGLGAILQPFNFLFIFGALEMDLPNAIIGVGMQKMLENSLDAYEAGLKKESAPTRIEPPKYRRSPRFVPVG